MPIFRVHIGLELPFWLALPEREYKVAWQGGTHSLTISNSVDRVEVGDFYLGSGAKGVVWCHQADGERTRAKLQEQNPRMPITRHALKTVVTHVRELEARDLDSVGTLYGQQRKKWVEETLQVVNRMIDAYSVAALLDKARGEAGRAAFWDIGLVIVSFWDQSGTRQLGGHTEHVRTQTPPPTPFDPKRQQIFQTLVDMDDEYPLRRLLSISAWSHIQRGNYRAAIVDDFNAIELAVTDLARELARDRRFPPDAVDHILRRLRFDDICSDLLPLVGGPKLTQWDKWPRVKKAQEIRHRVVHRGAHATRSDANTVHDAAIWTLTWLLAWQAAQAEESDPAP